MVEKALPHGGGSVFQAHPQTIMSSRLTRAVSVLLSSRLRERIHEDTSPLKLPKHPWRDVILCPLRRAANCRSDFCIPKYHRADTSRLCRRPLTLIIGLLLPFHFSIRKCWPS